MTWSAIPLGDIMAERRGTINPAQHPNETFDLYSIPAFDDGRPETVAGLKIGSTKQLVRPGDVLLSRIVPHIRRAWIVGNQDGRRLIASGEWIVFRSDRVLPHYLRHFLMHGHFHAQFMRTVAGVGGSLLRARPTQVAHIKIPLPPLGEQRRLAGILDKAEALRAKRRAALAKIDILPQAIFLELFGDPRSNEKSWCKVTIKSFVSDVRGGASLEPADFVESGFPVLHKGAIKPQGAIAVDSKKKTFATLEYVAANRRHVVGRDFMAVTLRDLVPTGPSIGLVADLRRAPFEEYLLAQGAYAFRIDSDKLVPEYLVYLSNMPSFRPLLRQNAVGSTQIHIRTPIYLAIQVPLPPIELQREFARRVLAVEKLKALQRTSLTELDRLFASLQSRAFSGEL